MEHRTRYNDPVPSTSRGIGRDIQRLKTDGAASIAELRDFLGQMHGRSPQEVLGAMAESSLLRSMILSTLAFIALFAVFTIGPWLIGRSTAAEETAKKEEPAAATEAQPAAATAETTEPATGTAVPPAETASASAGTPDEQRAVDALGIGETKTADPKANPLDKNLDNLLDGID